MAKNGFFNPKFDIWQRGTSFSGMPSTYTADRWFFVNNPPTNMLGNTFSVSRDTDVPTIGGDGADSLSNYSLNVSCVNNTTIVTNSIVAIQYYMEGWGWDFFAQQSIALGLWIKTTTTGNYYLSLSNYDYTWSYQTQMAIPTAGVWQNITKTISASPDTGNWNYKSGTGIIITILLCAGTNYLSSTSLDTWAGVSPVNTPTFSFGQIDQMNINSGSDYFKIALLQISNGSLGVVYPCRPYPLEPVNCKRYYNAVGQITPNEAFGTGYTSTTNDAFVLVPFPERMRQPPAVSYSNVTDFIIQPANISPSTVTLVPHNDIATKISLTTASAMTSDNVAMLLANNTLNAQLTMDAELPIRTQPPLTLAGYTAFGTLTTTLTISSLNINPGDLIIAIAADSATTSTATATCNGITMNIATSTTYGTNSSLYIFYSQITQPATNIDVITTFGSSVNSAAMVVFQVLGTAMQILDQTSTNSGTSTTGTSGITATAVQPLEFIIGAIATAGPNTDTVGTWDSTYNFVPDQNVGTNNGSNDTFLRTAYYVTGIQTTYEASITGMTARNFGGAVATFY